MYLLLALWRGYRYSNSNAHMLPVVIYDDTQNMGIRIGTIPVEDFLYAAILLSMNISLYQWQKNGKPSLLNFK